MQSFIWNVFKRGAQLQVGSRTFTYLCTTRLQLDYVFPLTECFVLNHLELPQTFKQTQNYKKKRRKIFVTTRWHCCIPDFFCICSCTQCLYLHSDSTLLGSLTYTDLESQGRLYAESAVGAEHSRYRVSHSWLSHNWESRYWSSPLHLCSVLQGPPTTIRPLESLHTRSRTASDTVGCWSHRWNTTALWEEDLKEEENIKLFFLCLTCFFSFAVILPLTCACAASYLLFQSGMGAHTGKQGVVGSQASRGQQDGRAVKWICWLFFVRLISCDISSPAEGRWGESTRPSADQSEGGVIQSRLHKARGRVIRRICSQNTVEYKYVEQIFTQSVCMNYCTKFVLKYNERFLKTTVPKITILDLDKQKIY